MKRECPSLFAALLVSLLVNVLLRSQTAYWPRAGLFSAVVCAPLLAGVGWLFARSWRLAADPVYKLLQLFPPQVYSDKRQHGVEWIAPAVT